MTAVALTRTRLKPTKELPPFCDGLRATKVGRKNVIELVIKPVRESRPKLPPASETARSGTSSSFPG